ncbi:MAG: hypothetical protein FWB97_10140 [Oscillospiraceae bacterium]|nr:hypothetical protein [Oscillospiraceae bacterium]
MTKTVKNIVMAFTLVATIFLVVFCVELFLVNREAGDSGAEATVSTEPPYEDGENGEPYDENDQEPQEGEPPHENGDEDEVPDPEGPEYPLEATRLELPMLAPELTLVVYVDESLFHVETGDFYWAFEYEGGGEASLRISFDFITPPGIRSLAERFLYGHLDGGDSLVLGERFIGDSALRGFAVVGDHEDGRTYEAWIHSLTGDQDTGMAVVFVANFQNEEQQSAIHTILSSMEMHSEADEENGAGEEDEAEQ